MGMFNVRKPRGFNHQYIYVDERKEKLTKMEEDAKVPQGYNLYHDQLYQDLYGQNKPEYHF